MKDRDFLKGIPQRAQRQDSLSDQLEDLHAVAVRLGMYDAADALRDKLVAASPAPAHEPQQRFACHLELEGTLDGKPDDCVLRTGNIEDCTQARPGMRPEDCPYWKPIEESGNG